LNLRLYCVQKSTEITFSIAAKAAVNFLRQILWAFGRMGTEAALTFGVIYPVVDKSGIFELKALVDDRLAQTVQSDSPASQGNH